MSVYDDIFDSDYEDFSDEILDHACKKALQRLYDEGVILTKGDTVKRDQFLLESVTPLEIEELYEEWQAAVDRAILILVENRALFDVTVEALRVGRLLNHKMLGALGFRNLSVTERIRREDLALRERLAQWSRLRPFKTELPSSET